MRVKDKVVLITGGASGIGRQTAMLLAREGAKLFIADFNAEQGQGTAEEIRQMGYECTFFEADVRSEAAAATFTRQAFERYGRIDVLFNNAGIGVRTAVEELSEEEWDQVIDTNLKGVFLFSKHVIPYMRKSGGGSIINCASVLAHVGHPEASAYNAAKAGVVMLTKHLAVTYGKDHIRANAVCPSFLQTAMLDGVDDEALTVLAQLHPLGRLADPIEVAYCVLFLASDESSYVTGSSLIVDGGYTAV